MVELVTMEPTKPNPISLIRHTIESILEFSYEMDSSYNHGFQAIKVTSSTTLNSSIKHHAYDSFQIIDELVHTQSYGSKSIVDPSQGKLF